MVVIKNFEWILPLSCGFMALLAIFAPAAYYVGQYGRLILWMWGWYDRVGIWDFGMESRFIPDVLILNVGIFCISLIVISASVFIISSILTAFRKSDRAFNKAVIIWFFSGILLIIAPIFWMVMYQIFHPFPAIGGEPNHGFWNEYSPGYAVIVPIVVGALSCGGITLFKIKKIFFTGKAKYIKAKVQ